jgi:hypothetical protein
MHWIFRGMSWRAVLIRTALLTAVWLVVAFVFATELYLSARGMPVRISWTDAARNAFRDWFPWMLLSPVAVILAGRFRFDRGTWRRSLMVHLAACLFFTIAYAGLLLLVLPGPFILSTYSFLARSSSMNLSAQIPFFAMAMKHKPNGEAWYP